MSTNLDDLDLDVIYSVAERSQKVQELINEKNSALNNISKQQKSSPNSPSPTPKPKGEINITKGQKKEIIPKEIAEKLKQEVKTDYNNQIKQEITNKAKNADYDDHVIEHINDFPPDDLSYLAENGREKFKEQEKSKQEVKKEDKKDLVTQMDEKESRDFWQENKSDIEQNKNEKDLDVTQNQDDKTLDTMQLDEEQYDDLMSSPNYIDIEEKDIEVNTDKSPPEPSDDYE